MLDCFPFFNELEVLSIRLHELAPVVDKFIILEAGETYGGESKPFNLEANWQAFKPFHDQIIYIKLLNLLPKCTDRKTGRLREAYQRDAILPAILEEASSPDDVVILSDCDEIPSRHAVKIYLQSDMASINRLKQFSFYYNVQTLVDYGHDFASRARIGTVQQLRECGSMYAFRMFQKDVCPAIEEGGWHFSYFGGVDRIKTKVAALSPFLAEYKLYGDTQLVQDIEAGKDLHHRRCEMPDLFTMLGEDSLFLPYYLRKNRTHFSHFFKKAARV